MYSIVNEVGAINCAKVSMVPEIRKAQCRNGSFKKKLLMNPLDISLHVYKPDGQLCQPYDLLQLAESGECHISHSLDMPGRW